MRICLVVGNLRERLDEGTSKSVLNLAKEFRKKGHNSFIFSKNKYKEEPNVKEKIQGITVYRQKMDIRNYFRNYKKIKKLDPDVVNVHSSSPRMALYCSKLHKKTVWTIPAYRGDWLDWNLWKIFAHQEIITTSERLREIIETESMKIPYGIDTERLNIKEPPHFDRTPNILYMGGPDKHRGFFSAIKVIKELRKGGLRPNFYIAVRERGNQKEKAREVIEEKGISSLSEVRGHIENLLPYYNKMDFVLDLIEDSGGITSPPIIPLEAMSCGRVVFCTNIKDFREVIDDGKDGFLYERGEEGKIAEKISGISQDELRRISKNARRKIISEYSIEKSAKKYIKLYNEMI